VGGPSQSEKTLQTEQAAETQQYMQQQSTLYSESQALQTTLKPQLESEINNPTGFNAQELAELNASNVNTTGAQYASVQKQLNLQNSSANMAGLTSGVAAGETAALKGEAAGTVASNAANVQLASANLAEQNKQTATSELLGLESGQMSGAIQTGSVENTSENNAFNQADTEEQQSSQMLNTIVGGVIGAGSTAMSAFCPAKGSLYLMGDGTEKPVEELAVGDKIAGIDGEKQTIEEIQTACCPTLRIETADGFVAHVSRVHAFALPKGGFVVAMFSWDKTIVTAKGTARVVSVKWDGNQEVFNVITDGSHTYRADGIWALGVGEAERHVSMERWQEIGASLEQNGRIQ
jgi:hypothetical protein